MPSTILKPNSDKKLLEILKTLRKRIAQQKSIPPFVVFQDPSLEDMAVQYPCTLDELANIIGVGVGKAKKFGSLFVSEIEQYVTENTIERPQDVVVKSAINKSGLKVFIIQSIDRKIPIEDIADSKGINMEKVLEEMEGIVASGTKLNIDYYLNEILDEDQQGDIFDYFMEAETDSISVAYDELQDDYEEEEIRLVKVKFLSEVAN